MRIPNITFYFLFFTLLSFKANGQLSIDLLELNSGTDNAIVDMCFSNDSTGFFLTDIGEVFYSSDEGNSWDMIYVDSTIITDSEYAGQEVTSLVSTPDSIFIFSNIFDLNDERCTRIKSSISNFEFSRDTINYWLTFPEFKNNSIWHRERVADSIAQYYPSFNGVYELYVDENILSASNDTKIYLSQDYGVTWFEKEFTSSPLSSSPYQSFYNGDTLYTITNYPTTVHKSFDGGESWTQNSLPTAYYKIFQTFLLGYSLWSGDQIYITDLDGNASFQNTVSEQILNLYLTSDKEGFLMGKEGMLLKIIMDIDLSPDEIRTSEQKQTIDIFPNPTTGVLNIDVSDDLEISSIDLLDLKGTLVKVLKQNQRVLDISELLRGTYILRITAKEGLFTKTIVLE